MATKAKSTKGVLLQRGDGGGSEVFTTIAEVKSFDGPTESAPDIEVSNFDSTAEEFIAGLPASGEVQMTLNFVGPDAQQQGLRTDLRAGTLRNFKLILNDHDTTKTTFAFAAIVKELGISGQTKAAVEAKCTLKLSGTPTVTYAPT